MKSLKRFDTKRYEQLILSINFSIFFQNRFYRNSKIYELDHSLKCFFPETAKLPYVIVREYKSQLNITQKNNIKNDILNKEIIKGPFPLTQFFIKFSLILAIKTLNSSFYVYLKKQSIF
ncbi:hypothetical protein BpHYR1_046685 [Brachionus plicatilis]|uniref:Uncharacterized protein n=1 Tax=Brachionus plicatilis TaxID=10195 RepID=A0A3M7RVQ5_BRAPC|nr:hypothetical protein BpHYR1_046685 [Brachionus plicatilis]